LAILLGSSGCHEKQLLCNPVGLDIPRELDKTLLPPYVIEPPDILVIDAIRVIPKPPYRIEPLDTLLIRVSGTPAESPIEGLYNVDPDGTVNLGVDYGVIKVAGLTLAEARTAIDQGLKQFLTNPRVVVSLAQSRGLQQIRGEHLVRLDGTIGLGTYGSVPVANLNIPQARAAIEAHLAVFLEEPEISVDVLAYNSKVFYIVTDGAGYGQQVVRLPITGNDTVLDAISQINGLAPQASKRHIWVARPTPTPSCGDQILPVDWNAIVECGQTATNYQLMPGDRLFIKSDSLIATDNLLSKVLTPIERLFGVTLLGSETVRGFGRTAANGAGTGAGF
jgi:polysaccharide export outer membrane protein